MKSTDRAAFKILLDPTDARFITGSDEDKARARAEWHRQRFVGQVMSDDLEELPRADLVFHRFSIVEDARSGKLYRVRRDGLMNLDLVPDAAAYYCDEAGTPVLLEKPPGPQTRAEADERKSVREQRRNAPRPRPSWLT